jgi:hypothetical protein
MRIAFFLGTAFFRERVRDDVESIGKAIVDLLDEGVAVPHIRRIRGLGATQDGFEWVFVLVHVLLAKGLAVDGVMRARRFILTAGLPIVNNDHGGGQLIKVL